MCLCRVRDEEDAQDEGQSLEQPRTHERIPPCVPPALGGATTEGRAAVAPAAASTALGRPFLALVARALVRDKDHRAEQRGRHEDQRDLYRAHDAAASVVH